MDELDTDYAEVQPGRLNDLVAMVQAGDIEGTAASVRDMTAWPISNAMVWAIIAVAGTNAIANLVRRSTPLGLPVVEAVADNMRKPPSP
jgi:hypothetical protein